MRIAFLFALATAGALALTPPAHADKPDHAGGGKGKSENHSGKGGGNADKGKGGGGQGGGSSINVDIRFGGSDRTVVREYFSDSGRGCPPGLAKKNNGCMPPGQAKKWAVGQPLPRDVVFYELPRELVVRLTPPPSGYRYIRAAADILLIATGTGMVIDAIEDLGRL